MKLSFLIFFAAIATITTCHPMKARHSQRKTQKKAETDIGGLDGLDGISILYLAANDLLTSPIPMACDDNSQNVIKSSCSGLVDSTSINRKPAIQIPRSILKRKGASSVKYSNDLNQSASRNDPTHSGSSSQKPKQISFSSKDIELSMKPPNQYIDISETIQSRFRVMKEVNKDFLQLCKELVEDPSLFSFIEVIDVTQDSFENCNLIKAVECLSLTIRDANGVEFEQEVIDTMPKLHTSQILYDVGIQFPVTLLTIAIIKSKDNVSDINIFSGLSDRQIELSVNSHHEDGPIPIAYCTVYYESLILTEEMKFSRVEACLSKLFEFGADLQKSGPTVAFRVVSRNHLKAIEILMEHGIRARLKIGSYPEISRKIIQKESIPCVHSLLHVAIRKTDIETGQRSIALRYPIGQTTGFEYINASNNIAVYLIDNGADMKMADAYLKSPFRLAVLSNDVPLVRYMLRKDLSLLTHSSSDGQTALMDAVENENLFMIQLLLNHANEPAEMLFGKQNRDGNSVMDIAFYLGRISQDSRDIVAYLNSLNLPQILYNVPAFSGMKILSSIKSEDAFTEILNEIRFEMDVYDIEVKIDSLVPRYEDEIAFKSNLQRMLYEYGQKCHLV